MTPDQDQFRHTRGYLMDYLVQVPDKTPGPYLHVFLHGMSRFDSQDPPVFARRAWSASLQSVCLFLSDPIFRHTQDSACGWYLLGEDEFMPQVLALQRRLLFEHNLRGTVWHGLCSGGYTALRYCVLSGRDDLAFAIAPHDDPRSLPQWDEEAAPFADLPGMAFPQPTAELLSRAPKQVRRYLYMAVSENDSYYALGHLAPIVRAAGENGGLRAVVLRNGRGHGFISDTDYEARLADAVRAWEAYRSGPDREEHSAGRAARLKT